MNVARENVDALNAVLTVKVRPEDYQKKWNTQLENYRKRANIPGFRQGKVPMGMVKKQFGKSLLAEELNKFINDSLYQYLSENKVDVLGNPIPKQDAPVVGDWDNPTEFEFQYEIGLSPEFKVKLDNKSKYEYLKVKVDAKLIDKQIGDLTRRYGKLISAETITENELLLGQFVELDEKNEIKPGGVLNSSTVSLEFIEDKNAKKLFEGKKVGDKITVEAAKIARGEADLAAMLGVKKEDLATIGKNFQFTINEIRKMEPAEISQDLFDKLFGKDEVKSEAEMRSRIAADLEKMFVNDSDRLLINAVYDDLIENTAIKLPDTFLKKWIKLSNEKEISDEQIEKEYAAYTKGLRWQLIQGKIFKENTIQLEGEEAVHFTKSLLANQYAQYGIPAPEDKELTESARKVLSDKKEANQIYDMLAERKLTDFIKNTVNLKTKELAYDDFVKAAQKGN